MPSSLVSPYTGQAFPDLIQASKKDVVLINQKELWVLANLHEFAQTHGITVVCKACDSAILGKNSGQEDHPSLECKCREFRYAG